MWYRTIGESLEGGPTPTAEASPGGVRDESIVEMVLKKPALNDIPSPPIGEFNNYAECIK